VRGRHSDSRPMFAIGESVVLESNRSFLDPGGYQGRHRNCTCLQINRPGLYANFESPGCPVHGDGSDEED